MSTNDTVASDYGLSDEAPVTGGGKERRIWETTSVAPDPHKPGYFYATQRLAGEWKQVFGQGAGPGESVLTWFSRQVELPPVTRVLYCTMDERGLMVNVFRDASQGKDLKIPKSEGNWNPQIYVTGPPMNVSELAKEVAKQLQFGGK